ncbi:hypothetical protein FBU30_004116 [Linnemannia zychae]|nr:hypothetical protein FBU30_004116 [Linnemannia zychae]
MVISCILRFSLISTRQQNTLSYLTTFVIIFSFFVITSTFHILVSAAPVDLRPRRNPLTIGLGLGNRPSSGRGGIGISVGGGVLLNLHRPYLHNRAMPSLAYEAATFEKTEVTSSIEKRSLTDDTLGENPMLRTPSRGKYRILPISPITIIPLDRYSLVGSEEMVHSIKKRQRLPLKNPGSGNQFNKDVPFGRRLS